MHRRYCLFILILALSSTAMASIQKGNAGPAVSRPGSLPTHRELKGWFRKIDWIAYTPTEYRPGMENQILPELLKADLEPLYQAGFRGIVTYSTKGNLFHVAEVAKSMGFEKVVLGIWTPSDSAEFRNALKAAPFADGYCVGNEGLSQSRYKKDEVLGTLRDLRHQTGLPVTTSETLDIVLDRSYRDMWNECDWIFVIAHFIFDKPLNSKDPGRGIRWVYDMQQAVAAVHQTTKPIVFKEIGFPTGGADWATEKSQYQFLRRLQRQSLLFCHFEAFDQDWKRHLPIEPHWGLFDAGRNPKRFASYRLRVSGERGRSSNRR